MFNFVAPGWHSAILQTTSLNQHFYSLPTRFNLLLTVFTDIFSGHFCITWTSAGLLSIESLGTNFSEILIDIQNFSSLKMRLKMSSAKWRSFCPEVDDLRAVFYSLTRCCTNVHFTNQCAIVIPTRWKFTCDFTQILITWLPYTV